MLPYLSDTDFLVGSVIALIVVLTCIDLLTKINFGRKHATNTPVQSYLPLLGMAHRILLTNPLVLQFENFKKHSSFYFWIFAKPYYATSDPDEAQIILTHRNTIEKSSHYRVLKTVFHESILISPAAVWRNTRKNFSILFKQKVLNEFLPFINEYSDEYIRKIKKEENTADLEHKNTELFVDHFFRNFCKFDTKEKLNEIRSECINIPKSTKMLRDWISHGGHHVGFVVSDSGGEIEIELIVTYKTDAKTRCTALACLQTINWETNNTYVQMNLSHPYKLLNSIVLRMLNPLYYFDCIYKLTLGGIEYFRTKDQLEMFHTEIIQSRRKTRMDPSYSEEIDGLSLIDIMDEGGMDFQDMMGNMSFITGAAGETSGKALTFALVVLGLYKDIQEKVYEEVIGATGSDGMVDSEALNNMKYTEMVLFETMRMFTPIPFVGRQVTEDLELKGRTIPKGLTVIISLSALHRNEKHWKDPKRFDPNRFSKEEVKNRHPYSFAPFSAGPRNCIAWKYANMIGTTILGKIVRKYEISSNLKSLEEIPLKAYTTLDVPKDIRVTFTPRND